MTDGQKHAITVRSVEAFCFRVPLETPVVTSFGRMLNRPAVFVRLTDADGVVGWGEAWCNFPSVGAEHRARLINDVLAPALVGRQFTGPADIYAQVTAQMSVIALQSGEHGPFAQAIAGLDIAAWDLVARRLGVPLWRLLGGTSPEIGVYASGINPGGALETAERAYRAGHRAFKLKIGFDVDHDIANLKAVRAALSGCSLAVDVNQGWNVDTALRLAPDLAAFDLMWLEEPMRADIPWPEWRRLSEATTVPLAGGENISGREAFEVAIAENILAVIQPDMAKWGGFTMCVQVGNAARASGRRYCPHYLGGGIGLLASAHLLATIGGDGLLEIDINENPLRDACCGSLAMISEGRAVLDQTPGLGTEPDLAAFDTYRTL